MNQCVNIHVTGWEQWLCVNNNGHVQLKLKSTKEEWSIPYMIKMSYLSLAQINRTSCNVQQQTSYNRCILSCLLCACAWHTFDCQRNSMHSWKAYFKCMTVNELCKELAKYINTTCNYMTASKNLNISA